MPEKVVQNLNFSNSVSDTCQMKKGEKYSKNIFKKNWVVYVGSWDVLADAKILLYGFERMPPTVINIKNELINLFISLKIIYGLHKPKIRIVSLE